MGIPRGSEKVERAEYDGSAATAQTVLAAHATQSRSLVRLQATGGAGFIRVFHGSDTAGKRFVNLKVPNGGGLAWQYEPDTAPVLPAGEDIMVIATASAAVIAEVLRVS